MSYLWNSCKVVIYLIDILSRTEHRGLNCNNLKKDHNSPLITTESGKTVDLRRDL